METLNAIGSVDEELLSNLLNPSALLSKILTSLCLFSCLYLVLAFLLFSLLFYYYHNESMAKLPSPDWHRKEMGGGQGLAPERGRY